jgi:hypothetical protein
MNSFTFVKRDDFTTYEDQVQITIFFVETHKVIIYDCNYWDIIHLCEYFINCSSLIFKIKPGQTQCEFHVVWWSVGVQQLLVRWNCLKKIRLKYCYSAANPTLLESCSSMFSTECVVPERGITLVMVDASSHFKFINLRILNWKLDMSYKKTCTTHTLDSWCKKSITSIWSEFFLLLMYQLIYKKNACQFQVHMRIRTWVLEFKWWKYYSLI